MKNKFILFFFLGLTLFAQKKTCDSKAEENLIEDLNSIIKCTVHDSPSKSERTKTKQIKVRVSAKKRFLVNRTRKATSSVVEKDLKQKIKLTKQNLLKTAEIVSLDELKKIEKFNSVDLIPSFSKCAEGSKEYRLNCFNKEMIKHINKHFYYPTDAINQKIQGEIWIRFIIDSNGYVTNLKTLGNSNTKSLQDVAKYVVSSLPKFEPAQKNGKNVAVKYGFPIDFSLNE